MLSREMHKKFMNEINEKKEPITIILDGTTDMSGRHVLGVLFVTLEDAAEPNTHLYRLLP